MSTYARLCRKIKNGEGVFTLEKLETLEGIINPWLEYELRPLFSVKKPHPSNLLVEVVNCIVPLSVTFHNFLAKLSQILIFVPFI